MDYFFVTCVFPDPVDHTSVAVIYILHVARCCISAIGMLANLLILFMVTRYPTMRTACNIYIANLAATDFAFCLVVLIQSVFPILQPSHYERSCDVSRVILIFLASASILLLTVIAVERHRAITNPLGSLQHGTVKHAGKICAVVWIVAALPAVIDTIARNVIANDWKFTGATLHSSSCILLNPAHGSFFVMTLLFFLFIYVLPSCIIIPLYVRILVKVRQSRRLVVRETRSDHQAFLMLFVVTVFFLVTWLPLHVVSLLIHIHRLVYVNDDNWVIIINVSFFFAVFNSVANPFLYALLGKTDFRKQLKKMFCCKMNTYEATDIAMDTTRTIDIAEGQAQATGGTRQTQATYGRGRICPRYRRDRTGPGYRRDRRNRRGPCYRPRLQAGQGRLRLRTGEAGYVHGTDGTGKAQATGGTGGIGEVHATGGTGQAQAKGGTSTQDVIDTDGTGQVQATGETGQAKATDGTGQTQATGGTGQAQASCETGQVKATGGTEQAQATGRAGQTQATSGTGQAQATDGTRQTQATDETGEVHATNGTGQTQATGGTGQTQATGGTRQTQATGRTGDVHDTDGTGHAQAIGGTGQAQATVETSAAKATGGIGTGYTFAIEEKAHSLTLKHPTFFATKMTEWGSNGPQNVLFIKS
ncbi:uncharacterized protein LOC144862668 [Branchiostoma floridae x Branchiostoma japonicum]